MYPVPYMYKWTILSEITSKNELLDTLLENRGITSPEEKQKFLKRTA